MTTSLFVTPAAPAAPTVPAGPSRPDQARPDEGFGAALGRAVDRQPPARPEGERPHVDHASEQGRVQRGENANARADHLRNAPPDEAATAVPGAADIEATTTATPTEEAADVQATESLVASTDASLVAPAVEDLEELVPALADEVESLLAASMAAASAAPVDSTVTPDVLVEGNEALLSEVPVELVASQATNLGAALVTSQQVPPQDVAVTELSTPSIAIADPSVDEAAVGTALPVDGGGMPLGGDLQAGPGVETRATVQPEGVAASPSPGLDAGPMTAAPDGAATQVAAELVDAPDEGPTVGSPSHQSGADRAVRRPDGAPVLLDVQEEGRTTPSGRVLPEQAMAHGVDRAPSLASRVPGHAAPSTGTGPDAVASAMAEAPSTALTGAPAISLDGVTPAAGLRGSGVVQRLADVARALENAPPPRSVVIDIESMRGLRLEVRLGQAGAVHVLAQGSSEAVQPLASLGRDLADALSQRGMHLGDFQAKEDGGRPGAGQADGDPAASQRDDTPRHPVIRPGAAPLPASGRTLTGLRL